MGSRMTENLGLNYQPTKLNQHDSSGGLHRIFSQNSTPFPRHFLWFSTQFPDFHLLYWLVVEPTPLKNDGVRQLG